MKARGIATQEQVLRTPFPYLDARVYLDTAAAGLCWQGHGDAVGRFYDGVKHRGYDAAPEWRRVAPAVLGCTRELGRHLMQQRWGRVDEAMEERRELLLLMKRMHLDADGRRCLLSLEQAAHESELAVAAMINRHR